VIAKLRCSFGYLTIALLDNDTQLRFVPHRILGFYMYRYYRGFCVG